MKWPKGYAPAPRIRPIAELKQAKLLERLAAKTALSLEGDILSATSSDARIKLARALRDAVSAWDTARDAVRVLRGRGLPKAVGETLPRGRRKAMTLHITEPGHIATETPKPSTDEDARPDAHTVDKTGENTPT